MFVCLFVCLKAPYFLRLVLDQLFRDLEGEDGMSRSDVDCEAFYANRQNSLQSLM
jgi:hypothetical protein